MFAQNQALQNACQKKKRSFVWLRPHPADFAFAKAYCGHVPVEAAVSPITVCYVFDCSVTISFYFFLVGL